MDNTTVYCSICDEKLTEEEFEREEIGEFKKYKCGELQYIELFHTWCKEDYPIRRSDNE